MQWRIPWLQQRKEEDPLMRDKQILLEEIRVAQIEWQHAVQRLDYALDPDQIDYAIYALEAAEKRYGMLLKNAKRMNVSVLYHDLGKAAGG
ncbi:DUF2508 family protein [Paenibacillus flagellatus]|nr:DUF2508 family protein [Paenibacillus flagellatus]